MATPSEPGTSKLDATFSEAAERFLELIRAFGGEVAGQAASAQDGSSLARRLAEELERWLQTSSSAQAWYGPNGGLGGVWSASPFAALPIGPRAEQPQDSQRTLDLLTRFAPGRISVVIHLAVMIAACFALPLHIATGWGKPPEVGEAFWLWIWDFPLPLPPTSSFKIPWSATPGRLKTRPAMVLPVRSTGFSRPV